MVPGGRITTPSFSLPAGWTAYTDVKTSKTYYVHLPTGDTQWTRPPPPPPPPPLPPHPNLPQLSATNPFVSSQYMVPFKIPPFHFQSRSFSNGADTLFNGGGNSSNSNTARLSYYPNVNQTTLPPLPHPTPSFNSISNSQLKRAQLPSQHAPIPPRKRSRVQPKSQANLITPESSNGRKWKECSKCKLQRGWHFFSKKQWQSGVARKCKSCVDETVVDSIERARAAAKAATSKLSTSATDHMSNTTTTCFHVKPSVAVAKTSSAKKVCKLSNTDSLVKSCSECKSRGTKDAFSKRQWLTRIRKCKSCTAKSRDISGNALLRDDSNGNIINASIACGDSNTQRINNSLASSSGRLVVKQEKS